MSPLTFFVLKIGFLILLWIFVFAVIYAIRSDLFGPRVRVLKQNAAQAAAQNAAQSAAQAAAISAAAPLAAPFPAAAAAPPSPPLLAPEPGLDATLDNPAPAESPIAPLLGGETEIVNFGHGNAAARSTPADLNLATADSARSVSITDGPLAGMKVELDGTPLTIGRSSDSGLTLKDDYTSNFHARMSVINGVWNIEDLGSTNGTTLDGMKVTSPVPIPLDASIRIGTSVLKVRR